MEFLIKNGVIRLAIAFKIGGATGKLVTALVNDLLFHPPFFIPSGDWTGNTGWVHEVPLWDLRNYGLRHHRAHRVPSHDATAKTRSGKFMESGKTTFQHFFIV